MFNKTVPVVATLMAAYTTPALANWGDKWSEMAWGAPTATNVPMMDGLGMALLAVALVAMAVKGLRSPGTLGLLLLVGVVGAVNNVEAQVSIPNTFVNGEVADADEVNANFEALADALDVTVPSSFANSGIADAEEVNSNFSALKTAVDTFTNDLTAATSATETAFTNGFLEAEDSIDITIDNVAVCTTAGGTYDAGTDSCSVDITIDNAAAEALAAAAAGSAACTQAGGTWDAGASTCTPAASAPYDCYVGGFCSHAAIYLPSFVFDEHPNAYAGHTEYTEPALSACTSSTGGYDDYSGDNLWRDGYSFWLSRGQDSRLGQLCQARK